MSAHSGFRTSETADRRESGRLTGDVQAAVDESGTQEGLVLVAAMHMTAAGWINDEEPVGE